MTFKKIYKSMFLIFLSSLIASCSDDNDVIFEHGAAGPNTEQQLKRLPEGLISDQQNSQHSKN